MARQSRSASVEAPVAPRTKEEQAKIVRDLALAGKSDEEIAQAIGLSVYQAKARRYALGIKKDRGGSIHIGGRRFASDPSAASAPDAGTSLFLRGTVDNADLAGQLDGLAGFIRSAPGDWDVSLTARRLIAQA